PARRGPGSGTAAHGNGHRATAPPEEPRPASAGAGAAGRREVARAAAPPEEARAADEPGHDLGRSHRSRRAGASIRRVVRQAPAGDRTQAEMVRAAGLVGRRGAGAGTHRALGCVPPDPASRPDDGSIDHEYDRYEVRPDPGRLLPDGLARKGRPPG